MVYQALVQRSRELSSRALVGVDPAGWADQAPERRRRWRDMLGLDPLPPRGDLRVTVTGVLPRDGLSIEKLHFEIAPLCRITANLYLPATPGPHPAVVYVCGHSPSGKAHYQPHARWFAEHGYVCLILDTIEIGEGTSTHHGVYREGWWHWYSQGFTPGGVEVWAAMRGADLLQSRPEVDPARLGITGISGGGAISWFTGAADDRFQVVAPVCQTGTIEQQILDRTVDGHCDCTYWINHERWDWADFGALIAPRALFVGAATEDGLWRPYSTREVVHRIHQLYFAQGLGDRVKLVEDLAPHSYTPKIRTALFAWFERHLKGIENAECDDVPPARETEADLRVFAEGRPPGDDRLRDIHRFFISLPEPTPAEGRTAFEAHRKWALGELRRRSFSTIPATRETPEYEARPRGHSETQRWTSFTFDTEPGLTIGGWLVTPLEGATPHPIIVAPVDPSARTTIYGQGAGLDGVATAAGARGTVEVRGVGRTSVGPGLEWSLRRSYPLFGQTLPERQTHDLLRGIDVLRAQPNVGRVAVFGQGASAALAIYAALLDEQIAEVVLRDPVTTHWDAGPEFLGVLRVGDLPQNLALLFPRPITFIGAPPEAYAWTRERYAALGAGERVRTVESLGAWRPMA